MPSCVSSKWYWKPNSRFLNRNAWLRHARVEEISTFPVGGGGAGGGAGLAGAGSFGRSNVSRWKWNIGDPSLRPNTIGSVPPGNGNVTGPQPYSGTYSVGSTGLGG